MCKFFFESNISVCNKKLGFRGLYNFSLITLNTKKDWRYVFFRNILTYIFKSIKFISPDLYYMNTVILVKALNPYVCPYIKIWKTNLIFKDLKNEQL